MGTLTREEARIHPNRNVITRAIGLEPNAQVDVSAIPIEDGDLILLCSDGLNSMISDSEIERILKETAPKEVCRSLIDAANYAGGHDNTTVAVATIGRASRSMSKPDDQDTLKVHRGPSSFLKAWNFIIRRK